MRQGKISLRFVFDIIMRTRLKAAAPLRYGAVNRVCLL